MLFFTKMRFIRWRRQRWVSQVVFLGKTIRDLEASRASISAVLWPEDAAYLDAEINRLTMKRDSLLTKIKETADVRA